MWQNLRQNLEYLVPNKSIIGSLTLTRNDQKSYHSFDAILPFLIAYLRVRLIYFAARQMLTNDVISLCMFIGQIWSHGSFADLHCKWNLVSQRLVKDLAHKWSCGVVVITSSLHAEGPQFDPGRDTSFLHHIQSYDSIYNRIISQSWNIHHSWTLMLDSTRKFIKRMEMKSILEC